MAKFRGGSGCYETDEATAILAAVLRRERHRLYPRGVIVLANPQLLAHYTKYQGFPG
jgi:hypothetical protein